MRSMSTYSKEILFRITVRLSEAVQSRSERSEQIGEALALSGIGRIFEVDIDTIETVILDELEGTHEKIESLYAACRAGMRPVSQVSSQLFYLLH